jgi:hypothetical protein
MRGRKRADAAMCKGGKRGEMSDVIGRATKTELGDAKKSSTLPVARRKGRERERWCTVFQYLQDRVQVLSNMCDDEDIILESCMVVWLKTEWRVSESV